MLILSRKPGESVIIGNSIRVIVLEVSPGAVRLGFDASPDVSVYREEIYKEIAEANRAVVEET
jgi:carbon storage regulator